MSNIRTDNIIIAVPKGRILEELVPLMKKANIIPEQGFFDSADRRLLFSSNIPWLKIIREIGVPVVLPSNTPDKI